MDLAFFKRILTGFRILTFQIILHIQNIASKPLFKTHLKKGDSIMNKGDLVNEVAKVVSSKKEAQAAVDCVLSTITDALTG